MAEDKAFAPDGKTWAWRSIVRACGVAFEFSYQPRTYAIYKIKLTLDTLGGPKLSLGIYSRWNETSKTSSFKKHLWSPIDRYLFPVLCNNQAYQVIKDQNHRDNIVDSGVLDKLALEIAKYSMILPLKAADIACFPRSQRDDVRNASVVKQLHLLRNLAVDRSKFQGKIEGARRLQAEMKNNIYNLRETTHPDIIEVMMLTDLVTQATEHKILPLTETEISFFPENQQDVVRNTSGIDHFRLLYKLPGFEVNDANFKKKLRDINRIPEIAKLLTGLSADDRRRLWLFPREVSRLSRLPLEIYAPIMSNTLKVMLPNLSNADEINRLVYAEYDVAYMCQYHAACTKKRLMEIPFDRKLACQLHDY
jgi:hypothetical protein